MTSDIDMDVDTDARAEHSHRCGGRACNSPLDTLALTATLLAPADALPHRTSTGFIPVIASATRAMTSASSPLPLPRATHLAPSEAAAASVGDPRLLCLDVAMMDALRDAHDRSSDFNNVVQDIYGCCCGDRTKGNHNPDVGPNHDDVDSTENKRHLSGEADIWLYPRQNLTLHLSPPRAWRCRQWFVMQMTSCLRLQGDALGSFARLTGNES
jgi:hypothetical protein